jgi:uncharacterized protein with FMN-binding domain
MSSHNVTAARRNAGVLAATAATVAILFLFPTSTNRSTTHLLPASGAAPAGVVAAPPTPGTTASPQAPPATATTTVNGAAADTQFGPVQVQIKVRAGRILSAVAIDYPQGSGRDQEINSYAIPLLQQETVTAQSARIDTISGATYTSDGYTRSLQSAIDAAHLK